MIRQLGLAAAALATVALVTHPVAGIAAQSSKPKEIVVAGRVSTCWTWTPCVSRCQLSGFLPADTSEAGLSGDGFPAAVNLARHA
jgi:hypothetical protein